MAEESRSRKPGLFDAVQAELAGWLTQVWHGGVSTGPFDGQDYAPPFELREEPDRYVLTVELPGVERPAVQITAEMTALCISGQKLAAPLPAGEQKGAEAGPDRDVTLMGTASLETQETSRILHSQRRYGGFCRRIPLPGPIQTEAVAASLTNGVLEVVAPKAARPKPVSIQVEIKTA